MHFSLPVSEQGSSSLLLMDTSNPFAPTSPNSSCISEEDLGSLQDGVGTASRASYTSTTSERQSESTFDDLLGEFGEASAPRADMDDFDIEMVSSASNQPSEASEASSAATGPPPPGSGGGKDGGPAYSYPMGFEMNDEVEEEVEDDVIPEMEATLMPVRQERSLSFGAAEVIEYEQVVIKDEDLIGADREMNDDDDDDEDDEEIDMHFPAGAADDYRAPNKDHLITNADDTGFDDPFEHHHTRSEEDSEEDLEKEEIRKIPGARDGACSDEEGNLREGAVNRTGFADDVVNDDLDKAEIRNYTEARTKADKPSAHVGGGECHYKERTDRNEKQQLQQSEDPFGFGEDDQGDNHYENDHDDDRHHQGAAQVTHTSRQSLVLVSTHTTCCIT